ncbi:hypothetical protein RSAG8_08206, partial [Rhizoctonia solani AG-8 WAC10335]
MPTTVGRHHPLAMVDRKQIATDLALASEALAAAADALTEAARAMSDASGTSRCKPVSIPGGMISDVSPTDTVTGKSAGAEIVNQGEPDRVNQHSAWNLNELAGYSPSYLLSDLPQRKRVPKTESGGPVLVSSTGSRATLSESNSQNGPETKATITPIYGSHQASHPSIEVKPELNNKFDPLPSYPGVSISNGNVDSSPEPTGDSSVSGSLSDVSRLLEDIKSYPTIPLGRNYISLDKVSDALAFIAYMALQVNKIICLIPDQYMSTCSELLKYLFRTNVYQVNTYHHLQDIYRELGTTLRPRSYHILLDPSLMSAALSPKHINPDCFIHWGQPKGNDHYGLNSFPTSVKICIVLVGKRHLNQRVRGVIPYSNEALNTCFNPNSPFQLLRQISAQPNLPRVKSRSTTSQPNSSTSEPPSNPGLPVSPRQERTTRPTPSGNYYIVINTEQDRDIIPIITYIALNSKRVMCHVPNNKDPATYKSLIELAYPNAIISTSATLASLEAAVARLKLVESGILLRGAAKDWNSFLSDSLVDCLIYCGIPQVKLKRYCNECKNKVTRSYLILTGSEYSRLQSQLTSSLRIKEHPYIRTSESSRPGSSLYDLSTKVAV